MDQQNLSQSSHWADQTAERILRERRLDEGDKASYVCASGITPSGTVHIGNFREIISVDLVVRALRDRGKKVRFIYSWDDYDAFRKVPKNMPKQEMLEGYLRWPIDLVPDPHGKEENYARANEAALERLLVVVGVQPEYLYQSKKYRASEYAEGIRVALENRDKIRGILDEFRSEALPADWWPVSVFSSFTNKDRTTVLAWDGEWGLSYRCDETGKEETLDLRSTPQVKLPWRVDWPMRWAFEGVDFEPAGKEHHSDGGSFDTAKKICAAVYGVEAPVSFKYDFITIKGQGGKISSSSGNVIGLDETLEVHTPELVRYLFAGTRPNTEFAISFDLDVIKNYEDYDRTERIYYGIDQANEKKKAKEKRIYELSQVDRPMAQQPFQLPFRHLCNLLLISNGDPRRAVLSFPEVEELEAAGKLTREWWSYAEKRAVCAWNWLQKYAPEDFVFQVRSALDAPLDLADLIGPGAANAALNAASSLAKLLGAESRKEQARLGEKELQDRLYDMAREAGLEPKTFFEALYYILVGKSSGPRLAGFLRTLGAERVLEIFSPYGIKA